MKSDYTAQSQTFFQKLQEQLAILEDTTIGNTMASAKKKIDEFYNYKTKAKLEIVELFMDLQAMFNTLSVK
jgi:hypothetical protein